MRIERPIRQVDAFDGVGERAQLERGRREPQLAIPRTNALPRVAFGELERQHALGTKRGSCLFVRSEFRRAAKLAILRLARWIEDGDRIAALAAHLALFRLPSALCVRDPAKRADQIVLDERAARCQCHRRFRAAERTHHLLLRGIPDRLAATCRTSELPLSRNLRHGQR